MATYEFAGQQGTILASCQLLAGTSGGGMRHYERFLGMDGSIQISSDPRWTRIGREAHAAAWDDWIQKRYLSRPETSPAPNDVPDSTTVRVSSEIEPYVLPITLDAPFSQPHLLNFFRAIAGLEPLNCPADVAFRSQVAASKAIEAAAMREPMKFAPRDFEA